ncbi:MBL fold metallo-hydrolase [Allobaculum sp. Allo2]|uniref:MBL fold metallo-hydrolase n=1 Tax=Allobaculum sp. Allo2 TaxID=2853432 RepID=UPI001F61D942|nr:MBL fold metallo-hydrolase [Allobaculum sp. Allo2]UNT92107.1 MBL fold metallo-hydrolase [Allobaculum sp. Allo2]
MEKPNVFVPLGGAQSVGDSCYFVRMNGVNILLDAGAAVHEGQIEYPDYEYLLRAGILESFSEINLILISHAHLDHCRGLPVLTNLAKMRKSGRQKRHGNWLSSSSKGDFIGICMLPIYG